MGDRPAWIDKVKEHYRFYSYFVLPVGENNVRAQHSTFVPEMPGFPVTKMPNPLPKMPNLKFYLLSPLFEVRKGQSLSLSLPPSPPPSA